MQTVKLKEYRLSLMQHLSYVFTKCLKPKGCIQLKFLDKATDRNICNAIFDPIKT